jgi:hypothetical protein
VDGAGAGSAVLIHVCLSSHGFGHGSRTAAVLAELANLRPQWRLVLSTGLPEAFLRLAFGPVPFELRRCRWDVGMVQADALGTDGPATLEALEELDGVLPEQVEREARWLERQEGPRLILADVPPTAALLARRVGAPLVWLASFGWDAIYRPLGGAFTARADQALALYRQGDLLIRCPLSLAMDWGVPALDVGLTASQPRLDAEDLAQQLVLPAQRDRCVLLSFGGLGLALDPALLAHWPEHVFVGPDPALSAAANGRVLPPGVRPLDLMPRIGRLITKAGYSSFCEAFTQGVGVHLVRRDGFAEAPVLERDLQRHGWHRLLSREQLEAGAWELDQPLKPPLEGPLAPDGARRAAAAIVRLAEEGSGDPIVSGGRV